MDIEEERKREERHRKEKEEQLKKAKEAAMSREEKEIKEIKEVTRDWSDGEKEVYALKEKDLGNEYYKGNEFEKALRYYTRSIAVYPTAVAYNNRAATYLKQCKYSKALEDTNKVLEIEPENVKAFYRRALALQHKNEFHKALDDIREVLKREPNHVIARHVADQLREHCESVPKKVKLLMKDEVPNDNPNNLKVVEVTQDEMLRDYSDKNFIEVNDWGLPKIMCNCNGKYSNDPGIQHDSNVRYQHLHT
ncbi:hypothetical protein AAG570_010707 [Ranatra chinensis]|uniref:Uncharacterized protein n=1 Tax=Ranatra chinensis TaxID=642074 RepID=A0ABD0YN99_9HEMI